MDFRPIETFGTAETLIEIGLLPPVVNDEIDFHRIQERLGNLDYAPESIVHLARPCAVADPLAVYLFEAVPAQTSGASEDGLGVTIWIPHGESLDDGFLYQRFLVFQTSGKASSQGPAILLKGDHNYPIRGGTLMEGMDGPLGVVDGLSSEIIYGLAALQACVA